MTHRGKLQACPLLLCFTAHNHGCYPHLSLASPLPSGLQFDCSVILISPEYTGTLASGIVMRPRWTVTKLNWPKNMCCWLVNVDLSNCPVHGPTCIFRPTTYLIIGMLSTDVWTCTIHDWFFTFTAQSTAKVRQCCGKTPTFKPLLNHCSSQHTNTSLHMHQNQHKFNKSKPKSYSMFDCAGHHSLSLWK